MAFKRELSKSELRRGMSWVIPWLRAAKVQEQRLDGYKLAMDAQNDVIMFVIVLANFLRGAEALLERNDPGIARFESQVPRAVDVRDLLTHFDAYLLGNGWLQNQKVATRRGVEQIGDFAVSFQFRPTVKVTVSGISVDVPQALAAMDEMVRYLDRLFDQVPAD
jgi:hypothetical protein